MAKSHHILSFKYAITGLKVALAEEPNLRTHFLIGLMVIICGFYFGLTISEWVVVTIMIGLVLTLELTNSAIETVVDSFTSEIHPKAKLAKDVSAAAVLVAATTSAIVGLLIFLPHIALDAQYLFK